MPIQIPNDLPATEVLQQENIFVMTENRAVMQDTAEKMYVKRAKKMWYLPILEKFCAPEDYERYLIMGKACLEHDTYERIHQIQAPTLVIGGAYDLVLEGESSVEIAERIT